ncbi:MAG: hypothetical protein FGM33_05610 [Candidatus Kapabacteria bacterium]|nr:hypothetical protein [Candidatus Kapabacteria bacterium]
MQLLITSILAMAVVTTVTTAIPQFSALSGNRCTNCHIAPSGGGIRNDLGWYSWYDVGMIPRDSSFLSWMYELDKENTFFDGLLTLGMDARIQSTRSFSSADAKRSTFPMQASLYAAITPIKAVTIEGTFNLAALRTGPNSDQRIVYPGQRMGSLSAIIAPSLSLPQLRIGLFRPSIGMRYDDHTMGAFGYATSARRQTLLAPDWSEYGAEITYEGLRWLTLQSGVFGSEGLSQVRISDGGSQNVSAIAGNQPTVTARAVVWPRAFDDMLNMWFGASVLRNNVFTLSSAFVGIGLSDHLSLMVDHTAMQLTDVISTKQTTAELLYQASTWAFPFVRLERYWTDQSQAQGTVLTDAAVLGAQIFVAPYVELRPEYRILDTFREGYASRWNLQLHIYY